MRELMSFVTARFCVRRDIKGLLRSKSLVLLVAWFAIVFSFSIISSLPESSSTIPHLTSAPTTGEITSARVFELPLIPMGKEPSQEENRALSDAIRSYLGRTHPDDDSGFQRFLQRFPNSSWRVGLLTDLGLVYRKSGYFTKALAAWEEAWAVGKNETGTDAAAIVDRAVAELAELNARLGRYDRLETLFTETAGRNIRGSNRQRMVDAKEGLALMNNRPEVAFLCGPLALDRIRTFENPTNAFCQKIREAQSTRNGFSLAQVLKLSGELEMGYRAAKRIQGAKVLLPAVVHWKAGHFAALITEKDGRFLVQDPTFGGDLWITQRALDEEASGYFLVPDDSQRGTKGIESQNLQQEATDGTENGDSPQACPTLPDGWRAVSNQEAATVWGKGSTSDNDRKATREIDLKNCPNLQGGEGMAAYAFHLMTVNLNIVDTPVGYRPPRGPAVQFRVTYNHREGDRSSPFTYGNLGNLWNYNWLSYIQDNPAVTNDVTLYARGGGALLFDYDSGAGTYAVQHDTQARLVRVSSTNYTLTHRDGSQEVFNVPDCTSCVTRKLFLSQVTDPAGNTLTLQYDANFRLTKVIDTIQQTNIITYASTNSGDSAYYRIAKVTDPYGRYATFDYNGSGQLTNITDVIGLKSEFIYNASDFITGLKTPYGTTTFSGGETNFSTGPHQMNRVRWLEATDPLSQKERVEYQDVLPLPMAETIVPTIPSTVTNANTLLRHRNSFYWDKKAMAEAPGDYSKARRTHWLHLGDGSGQCSGTVESEKPPLENRIWYTYPNQNATYFPQSHEGSMNKPVSISRVLDDGANQAYQFLYNSNGLVTYFVDPSNRRTTNIYAVNGIDLAEVRQFVGTNTELLASFTYSSQHLPLTATDAAGQITRFQYDANGQLIGVTNARNEKVTLTYSNGYLMGITGAIASAVTSFTYDGTNRVRTITDSEGYTVTIDYDAADRPTKITYPNSTYEQFVYQWLDQVGYRDRLGRWTRTRFNALRQPELVEDALGRQTFFDWCGCGGLNSITDPLGRVTSWLRDIQGRVTKKTYPDGKGMTYAYESTTSRLKSLTDPKSQTTLYEYFVDNNLKQISYSNAVISTPSVIYTYHSNYNRLNSMADGIGTTSYGYYSATNGLGALRLSSIDGPFANDTVEYQYDELGRATNRAINGVAQQLTFDELRRISGATNVLGTFATLFVGATPRPEFVFYPNNQIIEFGYFGNSNDRRLEYLYNYDPGGGIISGFEYTYDAEGQITTWTQHTNAAPANVYELGYDNANQLLSAVLRSNNVSGIVLKKYIYTYDKAGNRIGEQINGYPSLAKFNNLNQFTNRVGGGPLRFKGNITETGSVTVAGNFATMISNTNFSGYASIVAGTNTVAVVATDFSNNSRTNNYQTVVTNTVTARTLKYDLNGNQTNAVTGTTNIILEWDAADRLAAITIGTNRCEFSYDGFGRRVKLIEQTNGVAKGTNLFLWCGAQLCEERDSTGGSVTRRFFGQGEQIAATNYFFARDHLGSIREMIDSGGALRARYDYDPYGRRTKLSGDADGDFGFTGHYFHSSTAQHLALYRTYDADSGRWSSRDPIEEGESLNLYAYGLNNPITLIDVLGLSPEDVQKFQKIFDTSVAQMSASGERIDAGWWNNLWVWGNPWKRKGCAKQTDTVIADLLDNQLVGPYDDYPKWRPGFDDQWTFTHMRRDLPPHQWVEARSSNPTDPVVTLDPFFNSIVLQWKPNVPFLFSGSNINASPASVAGPLPAEAFSSYTGSR